MAGNQSVPCPSCGAPLSVSLTVQVEARLTKRKPEGYGLGALEQTPAKIRTRLEERYCDGDSRLHFEPDLERGEIGDLVVICERRCGFVGMINDDRGPLH